MTKRTEFLLFLTKEEYCTHQGSVRRGIASLGPFGTDKRMKKRIEIQAARVIKQKVFVVAFDHSEYRGTDNRI